MTNDTTSVHNVITSQDEASTAEAIRLHGAGRANTIGRWDLLWRMWREGKSFAEMGRWIGRHPTTVKQLLNRAFKHKLATGMPWPTDESGRKICDIPHPAPANVDFDRNWVHPRSMSCRLSFRCRVCGAAWFRGKPLVDVFAEQLRKQNADTRTSKSTDY